MPQVCDLILERYIQTQKSAYKYLIVCTSDRVKNVQFTVQTKMAVFILSWACQIALISPVFFFSNYPDFTWIGTKESGKLVLSYKHPVKNARSGVSNSNVYFKRRNRHQYIRNENTHWIFVEHSIQSSISNQTKINSH